MIMRYGPDLVIGPDGKYHVAESSVISIRRTDDHEAHKSERYRIVLDGGTAEHLSRGSLATIRVNPGLHNLHVAGSFGNRSPKLKFRIQAGQRLSFVCGATDGDPPIWLARDLSSPDAASTSAAETTQGESMYQPEPLPKPSTPPDRLANISIGCGVLWGWGFLSVIGVIFAVLALQQAKAFPGYGRGRAYAGLVLGLIGLTFSVLLTVIVLHS